ncbi:glycoside hydrolase family 13 protein [Biscogniauxia sp. FL1348]|nr:glycoside hydrolase family 13 protein [Biscogniauxia sp. FL1348]
MMRKSAWFAALWTTAAQALTPAEWKKQSIYQVLTDRFAKTDGSTDACSNLRNYCGGTYQGLINKLDYIQGMGFTAIWISPIVKNLEETTPYGDAYHGYWAEDIYSLNSHFGTEDDLKNLSTALHNRGMYLMLDVVTNHMGYDGCGTCVQYSDFNPFNSASYYHSYCAIDYSNNTSVQVCWQGDNTVSLPDIRTEDSGVRDTFNGWITDIVSTYGIDGLRIDSTKHVEKGFFPGFQSAAGVHVLGEVYDGDPSVFPDWLNYVSGLLNYPAYYWITRAFQSTSATTTELLNGINTMKGSMETTVLGTFLENHDQARFASLTSDKALAKNAIALTMLMDGTPIIYQGQEQGFSGAEDPNNREALWTSGYSTTAELYTWIAKVNAIRLAAAATGTGYNDYRAVPTAPDSHTIALRKGSAGAQVVSVHTNIGARGSQYSVSLASSFTGFTANLALTEVMGCTATAADGSGNLALTMGTTAQIYVPTTLLSGTGICNGTDTGGGSGGACASVSITFNELVTTAYGETIKVVGNVAELGNWNPSGGVTLSASSYTASNPLWKGTVALTSPGSTLSYKYVRVSSSGTVTWEADPNHSLALSAATCSSGAITVNDSWQS